MERDNGLGKYKNRNTNDKWQKYKELKHSALAPVGREKTGIK